MILSCFATANKAKQLQLKVCLWHFLNLEKQPYRNKPDAFSFLLGFLECHLSLEGLEVCPCGTWEWDQHLPKLPSHPSVLTKRKEGCTDNLLKDYNNYSSWD